MKRSFYLLSLAFTVLLHFNAAAYQASYYNGIIVTEPHGINETNFPVLVTVNTQALISAGQMMATGADIRFSDSICPVVPAFLDYYIESGLNTTNTKIWVRMPSFAASATDTIYMLYGDNTATAVQSFSATFPNALITGGSNINVTGTQNVGWLQVDANDTLFLTAGSPVTFNAEKVIISPTGAVIGDGAGYAVNGLNTASGNGPGAGTASVGGGAGAGGGSYGGLGGGGGGDFGDIPGAGGAVYGTATGADIDMGSSGGSTDNSFGGAGGGAVSFYSNDFAMNGLVSMRGADAPNGGARNGGGGAGGGVLVMARTIDGTGGAFIATGGNGGSGGSTANDGGGGGGGGRIKLFYNSFNIVSGFTAGGIGGIYGDSTYGQNGAAGTFNVIPLSYIDPTISAQGNANPNITIGADPGTIVCAGTPITFIASVTGGGIAPVFQWFLNGSPVGANSSTYTLDAPATGNTIKCVLSTPGICLGTTDTSNSITVIANPPSPHLAGTIGSSESQSFYVDAPLDARYAADCDLMASISPSGVNPVNGNTNFKVTIDNVVNYYNGQPFATRHFDIEPSTTASTATASMTLYAYQYEFDDYNFAAASLGLPLLPSGGVDNGNVRITQFHGTGTAPGNYTGTEELITPNVSWDATNNWWVMDFPVTGFSGFYIHTTLGSHPLAVSVSDIRAANVDKRNRIDWQTATEETGDVFALQRSRDGKDFVDIFSLQAKGGPSTYTYWDEHPFTGINYYRVGLKGKDGSLSYTRVVSATVGGENTLVMTAYPNPVKDIVTVKLSGARAANGMLMLTDLMGRTVKTLAFDLDNLSIDMSDVPSGNYFIKYTDDLRSEVLKLNKQ